jgi:hypothetical protein
MSFGFRIGLLFRIFIILGLEMGSVINFTRRIATRATPPLLSGTWIIISKAREVEIWGDIPNLGPDFNLPAG